MAKYLKSDSEKGYIEDYVDIQALKFDNVRHTALGNMLGDYDNEGNYVIVPEIVNELLAMPKYVVEVMDNLEICLSIVKFDKQLTFLVAFEGEKATLSLLEKVSFEANNKLDAGTWSNVNEYVLDVVETIGEVDRQALYMKWNIQTFPGNVIDIFNCEDGVLAKYFNIINRIKYNMEVKSALLEKEEDLEEVEAEYALDMFTILQGYPELLKLVQTQLKKEITEKKDFLKLDKPNFAKTFNELLNKAIEGNVGKLSEFERDNFESDKRNVKIKSNIKKYDAINVQEEKFELEDGKTSDKKLIKIPAEGYKYQTFEGSAQSMAKTEKDAVDNSTQKAIDILLGKGKNKKAQLYGILSQFGIKPESIASASVMETVKTRTLKELQSETARTNTTSTNSTMATRTGTKVVKNKNETKTKKKEGKETKIEDKKEKKEEKTSSSGGVVGNSGGSGRQFQQDDQQVNKTIKFRTLEELDNNKRLIGQRVGTDNNTTKEGVMGVDQLNQIMAKRNNLVAKQNEASNDVKNPVIVREQTAPANSINDTMGV